MTAQQTPKMLAHPDPFRKWAFLIAPEDKTQPVKCIALSEKTKAKLEISTQKVQDRILWKIWKDGEDTTL